MTTTQKDINMLLNIINKADTIESAFNYAHFFRNFTLCQLTNEQAITIEHLAVAHSSFINEKYQEWTDNCFQFLYRGEPDYCNNQCGVYKRPN